MPELTRNCQQHEASGSSFVECVQHLEVALHHAPVQHLVLLALLLRRVAHVIDSEPDHEGAVGRRPVHVHLVLPIVDRREELPALLHECLCAPKMRRHNLVIDGGGAARKVKRERLGRTQFIDQEIEPFKCVRGGLVGL